MEDRVMHMGRIVLCLKWALIVAAASFLGPGLAAAAPSVMCFEKIASTAFGDRSTGIAGGAHFLNFAPHPSGNKAAVGLRNGVIKLMTLPPPGSTEPMKVISTFLDIRRRVSQLRGPSWIEGSAGLEEGLLGIAFHPDFANNGRFFVSYACNPLLHKGCRAPEAPCHCDFVRGCGKTCAVCAVATVIAEYTTDPTAGRPLDATFLSEKETRVLAFGRPFPNHVGGQILFDQSGHLIVQSGDGGAENDRCQFGQNGQVFFGKLLRLDVNKVPAGQSYGIPADNPFINNPAVRPEIYALGFRNPWGCDADPITGSLICADVGGNKREEVDVIVPGGNYGWNCYEGTLKARDCNTSQAQGIAFVAPAVEIPHPTMECVVGGVVYRGADSCLYGKYVYNDLQGDYFISDLNSYAFNSSNSYAKAPFQCASTSPMKCNSRSPMGIMRWGWGKDLAGNAYALTTSGIFRLVSPSKCGGTC